MNIGQREEIEQAVEAVARQFRQVRARGLDPGAVCIALGNDYATHGKCCDCRECLLTMVAMLTIGCDYILTHSDSESMAVIREAISRHENAVAGMDYRGKHYHEMYGDIAARIRAGIRPK